MATRSKRPTFIPRRPQILAVWGRAPIPVDGAASSEERRERFVSVVAEAMQRPVPRTIVWRPRFHRLAVSAAAACLMLLAVGTGLARTGGRAFVSRVSELLRSAGVVTHAPAPTAQPPATPRDAPPTGPCAAPSASPVGPVTDLRALAPPATQPPTSQPSTARRASGGPPPVATPAAIGGPPVDAAPAGPLAPVDLANQNRLFAEAMTARRRGEASEALRALDDFLRRYPQSPLAQDAHVERFRTLAETGDRLAAAGAARAYLLLYPRGFAREEATALAPEPRR
jgi:hypothetical protein